MKTTKKIVRVLTDFSLKSLMVASIISSVLFYYPTQAAAPDAFSPLSDLALKFTGNLSVENFTTKELRMLIQAEKIERYLSRYEGNLSEYAFELAYYADLYDLPYTLVASIGVVESGACTDNFASNNCFGWGNKVEFSSVEEAIKIVSLNLGGQNPRTANFYRPSYSIEKRMGYYNSVNPDYWRKLSLVMKGIENQDWQE